MCCLCFVFMGLPCTDKKFFFILSVYISIYWGQAHELCESRGGRPGLPSLISLLFLWT